MTRPNMALVLEEGQQVRWREVPPAGEPRPGHAIVRIAAVALNHLDLFSRRGMAFSRRALPLVAGVEGAGVVARVAPDVADRRAGDRVAIYPGAICGTCDRCRSGRENLCEGEAGILGFHRDGVAAREVEVPAHLLRTVPDGLPMMYAACAPVTYATVVHMLCVNAALRPAETVLIHAAGSGIGSLAIRLANHVGASIFATVGSPEKVAPARRLGAHYVIDYAREPFQNVIRRITERRGVDVVFEHVGQATWPGSILSLARGGRLVTCGATSGGRTQLDLMHLFNRQIKILASFGGTIADMEAGLRLMAEQQVLPCIDSVVAPQDVGAQYEKLARRAVFGKIIIDHSR